MCYSAEPKSLGRLAYEAYCESTGGVSLISGDKLPDFDVLKPAIQDAWVAAASAVKTELDSKCGCIHGS